MKSFSRSLFFAFVCLSLFSAVQNARSPDEEADDRQNPRRAPAQRPLRRQMSTDLYKSKECRDDLFKYCPIARENELNDLAVMQCFYDKVPDLSVLDEECQHVSWPSLRLS